MRASRNGFQNVETALGRLYHKWLPFIFEGNPVGEGTTRRGTATPVHRPQRPAGSTHMLGNFWGRIKGAKYRFVLQDGTWDFP